MAFASTDPARAGPLLLLRDGDFRRVWLAGAITGTTRWLDTLAISIFVFDLTGSPFQVALMIFARLVPMVLFGAPVGAIAERFSRKVLLTAAMSVACVTSAVLAVLVVAEMIELWHIALGAFLSGILWAGELPVRRTMLGEIAGSDRVGTGMALDSASFNFTRMLGPTLGGLLLQTIGLEGAYLCGALLYGCGAVLVSRLGYVQTAPAARDPGFLTNLREGLRFVRSRRVIVAVLVATVIMNLFAFSYTGMIPVVGRQELGLSALAIGLLVSAEGCGALIGALVIAWRGQPPHYRRLFLSGSFLLLSMILAFTFSQWFALSLLLLFVGGFGMAGFGTMQSTLVFTSAAPEMRSRVMGVLAFCIGTGPIGVLHVGALADWLGTSTAIAVIAVEGLIGLVAVFFLWPELRRRHT